MKLSKTSKSTSALFFFLFLVLSQEAYSQDFSSIEQDLTQLEILIADTLANTEEQQRLLADLNQNLINSETLISKLRDNNTRARELALDLTGTTDRNVRNLQDAIAIIGEIRRKLQVLEDFYANSSTGNSSD